MEEFLESMALFQNPKFTPVASSSAVVCLSQPPENVGGLICIDKSDCISKASMDLKDGNVELINETIKRLLEDRKNRAAAGGNFSQGRDDDDKDDHLILSRLLSQLESLQGNGERVQKLEDVTKTFSDDELEPNKLETNTRNGGSEDIDKQEIVKELNKVKRQNTITHWLLSVMIVLTFAWQASEVTMILKVKHGLSHPFSSIWRLVWGGGSDHKVKEEYYNGALPSLKMPELPSVELPDIGLTGEKH